jgi:putative copper export protein
MRDQLTVLNAFVHDVATGTWISCLALVSLVHHEMAKPEWSGGAAFAQHLLSRFMVLTWASLATIILTGVVRAITFRAYGWTGDVARERARLLKIKHALLGTAFLAGTAWQVSVVYF